MYQLTASTSLGNAAPPQLTAHRKPSHISMGPDSPTSLIGGKCQTEVCLADPMRPLPLSALGNQAPLALLRRRRVHKHDAHPMRDSMPGFV